jgi:hypothetical protein
MLPAHAPHSSFAAPTGHDRRAREAHEAREARRAIVASIT